MEKPIDVNMGVNPYTGAEKKPDKTIDWDKEDGMKRDQKRFRNNTSIHSLGTPYRQTAKDS